MLILIAGMPRSGSTFSFNVAKELASARGSTFWETSHSLYGARERSKNADFVFLKTHQLDQASLKMVLDGRVKVICTIRRPEDAVFSYMTIFGFSLEEASAAVRQWLEFFCTIKPHAFVLPYWQVERFPLLAALRIARALSMTPSPSELWRIRNRNRKSRVYKETSDMESRSGLIDIGFSKFDPNTFFHRRHISSIEPRCARDMLPPEQLRAIRDSLHPFVSENGTLELS